MSGHCRRIKAQLRSLKEIQVSGLISVCKDWIEFPHDHCHNERKRLYPQHITFWLFLSQVLSKVDSCRKVVRKALAWLLVKKGRTASPNTAGYCKARQRLSESSLKEIHQQSIKNEEKDNDGDSLWCQRRVRIVDGTTLSMPDTYENQKAYPQPGTQTKGCGFPLMRLTAVFSLATGFFLYMKWGPLKVGEGTLFRKMWHLFKPKDVILSDRGFCSFANIWFLLCRGIDSVMRKNQRLKTSIKKKPAWEKRLDYPVG
jgi:hypothetical protein